MSRIFGFVHCENAVAICLQFITRTWKKPDKHVYSPWCGTYMGNYPNLHDYIRNRAMMTKPEFEAYLLEKYKWWMSNYYKNEDRFFFNFFTKELMQEIIQLEEEWANPAIDLEATLAKIISFFMKHLEGNYHPKQTFVILMYILSSKCFYINRRSISKKWKDKLGCDFFLDTQINRNMRTQAFFFQSLVNFMTCNPSLLPIIQNFRENDARIFNSVSNGFKMLTTLFLKNNVPYPSLSCQIQQQICESSCNLLYGMNQDTLLWYRMINQKFHSIQNMHPKFRRFLIGRSHFTLFLVLKLFHQVRRIPSSFSAKLMLTMGFFKKLVKPNHQIKRFLNIQKA